MGPMKLSDIVRIDSPEAVQKEVQVILGRISPTLDPGPVDAAFHMIIKVFEGRYPGYRACDTLYHDLRHTTDAFLAMARLIHGGMLNGETFTHRQVITALIAALFHDSGYIREDGDGVGTGAKYTRNHEERSADFLARHGRDQGLSAQEIEEGRVMILCTKLSQDLWGLSFPSPPIELLGKLLNAADLLGQMSDRTYLEKLLFLFQEFREGGMGDYKSEVDLLKRTPAFYRFIEGRLASISGKLDRFILSHFEERWNIHTDLYREAIARQMDYLDWILSLESDHLVHLRRFGILNSVPAGCCGAPGGVA